MDGDHRVAAGITDHDKRDWGFVMIFFHGINTDTGRAVRNWRWWKKSLWGKL